MKIFLAPMEGVVDFTLRELLTGIGGIDVCVSEFVRVSGSLLPASVFHRLVPELQQGGRTLSGTPVLLQLLGSEPGLMAENAVRAVELGAPGIDLNFGCPAKTVNKSRGGAVLLNEPEVIYQIVSAVRSAVPAEVPVSAKMRLGYLDKSLAIENACAIESAGAGTLTVHARTKTEGYRPPAHWEWIARIREAVGIKVIANGEVWTIDDYRRCQEVSQCADVMIGRGLVANPFLARQIHASFSADMPLVLPEQTWPELLPLLTDFHSRVTRDLSIRHVHGRLKQWVQMLTRYYPQAKDLFQLIRTETCPEQLLNLLQREQARMKAA